jgi:hypothetical protein
MDERRRVILEELKNQCAEKQQREFEHYWEIWGVNWYPWSVDFPDGTHLSFTANDISLEDLYYFAEIGELEVVKVYEDHEMPEEFNRVRFRLKETA